MFDANEMQRKTWLRELSDAADNNINARRRDAIAGLGEKHVLHPANAPTKGTYNPMTGARLV